MVSEHPMVSVRGLCLRFPNFELRKVTFDVQAGEYFVLLGPTGSGKTLLIESLCGLHAPQAGEIRIAGRDVIRLDPSERGIGYVPQDYALLPFKTVEDNIAFGLEARRLPPQQIADRAGEMLDLLGIRHLAGRYPGKLSGGERQRVALGRALAIRPSVLLLDEPFSAIDEGMREELGQEIRQLLQQLGTTTIHICHSIEEAVRLGDRMAVMRDGCLVQAGAPREILTRPEDIFTARFLRLPNLVTGEVRVENGEKAFFAGEVRVPAGNLPEGPATAVLPFESMTLSRERPIPDPGIAVFAATVLTSFSQAFRPELRLDGDVSLTVPGIFPEDEWPPGREVYVALPCDSIHILSGT